jgi:hypothetical protein
MGQNNGNGTTTRAKVEPGLNQEVRLKLLKDKPFTGENGYGKYYLYSVQDLDDGEEKAFFAPADVHQIIEDKKLTKGSEFIIKKVPYQNGKKIGSKLELSLISVAAAPPPVSSTQPSADNLKEIMRQCLAEAVEIVHSLPDIPFQNDDIRAICASLFIARTR